MGWDLNDWMSVLPGPLANLAGRNRIDESYKAQGAATQDAMNQMALGLQRQQGLYQPLINVGDQWLSAMQQGVDSGQFLPGESVFSGFPGAYLNRQGEQGFSYGQQAPQFNQYQQSTQHPSFYSTPDAPQAQYYDPATQPQYQSQEFNIGNDPVYRRRLEESGKAIESSGAAQGMQLSGATLKALQENAQGIAAEEGEAAYSRWRDRDITGYGRWQDQQNAIREAMQTQTEDQYRRYLDSAGIRGAEAEQAVNQWNINRQFGQEASIQNYGAGLQGYDTGFQNTLAGWGANIGQWNQNRAFDYGYNTDAYNRAVQRGLTQYGMIGDLANLGTTARGSLGQGYTDYYGSIADLGIGQANAYAAAQQAKNEQSGILSWLGL